MSVTVPMTLLVAGSILRIWLGPETQSALASQSTSNGNRSSTGMLVALFGAGVDARDGVVVQVRGPHRAAAERDVARALADRDRRPADLAAGVAAVAAVPAREREHDDERDDRRQRGAADQGDQRQLALLLRLDVAGRGAR